MFLMRFSFLLWLVKTGFPKFVGMDELGPSGELPNNLSESIYFPPPILISDVL